jgi:preprotein translocase subunit Sec61beta
VKIVSPALIASNLNKTRFVVINDVRNITRFKQLLREISDLEWEERMTLELPKLFPRLAKEEEPNVTKKKPQWLIIIGVFVIILLFLICGKSRTKDKQKVE